MRRPLVVTMNEIRTTSGSGSPFMWVYQIALAHMDKWCITLCPLSFLQASESSGRSWSDVSSSSWLSKPWFNIEIQHGSLKLLAPSWCYPWNLHLPLAKSHETAEQGGFKQGHWNKTSWVWILTVPLATLDKLFDFSELFHYLYNIILLLIIYLIMGYVIVRIKWL